MTNVFSDSDIDRIATERHEHSYVELFDSKQINPNTGKQQRSFRCEVCGKIRIVTVMDSE